MITEQGEHRITSIPGISSFRIADFPRAMQQGNFQGIMQYFRELIASLAAKAEYLLITTVYEIESEAIDSLKTELPCPIYPIGLAIPSLNINSKDDDDHISWLNSQPRASVLYISQGSLFSSSDEQLDEFVAGVRDSGVRFFWVARENRERFRRDDDSSINGLFVRWCDQLKVLSHPSIGGFWSHCGWNSAKEAAFSGVPVLASPIMWDQYTNGKQIVEDWEIGWRLKKDNDGGLVKREEISGILKRFMDSECEQVKEMRRRAREISEICRRASTEDCGSSELQIEAFIQQISRLRN